MLAAGTPLNASLPNHRPAVHDFHAVSAHGRSKEWLISSDAPVPGSWGPSAFDKLKRIDEPIRVQAGYSPPAQQQKQIKAVLPQQLPILQRLPSTRQMKKSGDRATSRDGDMGAVPHELVPCVWVPREETESDDAAGTMRLMTTLLQFRNSPDAMRELTCDFERRLELGSDFSSSSAGSTGSCSPVEYRPISSPNSQDKRPLAWRAYQAAEAVKAQGESKLLTLSKYMPERLERSVWRLGDFKLLQQLHEGYAANVYHALCRRSGEDVLVKVYPRWQHGLSSAGRASAIREMRIQSRVHHPSIVELYASFEEADQVVLVQEFAGARCLASYTGTANSERWVVTAVLLPLLSALGWLHQHGVVHRDIKPENAVFDTRGDLKLIDFGLAMQEGDKDEMLRAGTIGYMAPEVLACAGGAGSKPLDAALSAAGYGAASDVWSVGALLYELLVGRLPFPPADPEAMLWRMLHQQIVWPPLLSSLAVDFLHRTLAVYDRSRASIAELQRHPLVMKYQGRSRLRE